MLSANNFFPKLLLTLFPFFGALVFTVVFWELMDTQHSLVFFALFIRYSFVGHFFQSQTSN